MNKNTIIIIENPLILYTENFINIIHDFGYIYLYFNNHIEVKYYDIKKINYIKVMCRIDLLNKISMFFNPTFQDFYSWGLPKNITNEAVIILAINNLQKHKKFLFYYDFKKKYNNNKQKNINYNIIDDEESYLNDIPKLDMNSPEGFSIFVSDWEKEFIKENSKNIKHLKEKNKRKLDINELDIKVKYILNNFLLYI